MPYFGKVEAIYKDWSQSIDKDNIMKMEIPSALPALCEGNPLLIGGLLSQTTNNAEPWCHLCYQLEEGVEQTRWRSCDVSDVIIRML